MTLGEGLLAGRLSSVYVETPGTDYVCRTVLIPPGICSGCGDFGYIFAEFYNGANCTGGFVGSAWMYSQGATGPNTHDAAEVDQVMLNSYAQMMQRAAADGQQPTGSSQRAAGHLARVHIQQEILHQVRLFPGHLDHEHTLGDNHGPLTGHSGGRPSEVGRHAVGLRVSAETFPRKCHGAWVGTPLVRPGYRVCPTSQAITPMLAPSTASSG